MVLRKVYSPLVFLLYAQPHTKQNYQIVSRVFCESSPSLTWGSAQRPLRRNARQNRNRRTCTQLQRVITPPHMAAMEAALASIESLDEGENFTYPDVAKIYNVDRSTLSRRHRKVQAPKAEQAINQRLLSPHQEEELVRYIIRLTERGLPPTREMITNFARKVGRKEVGKGWMDRFVARNKDQLITK
jgi:hypothetical protein